LFVPLSLSPALHNWIPENPKRRVLKWENYKQILLTKSGLEIPIHWLTSNDPDSDVVIYKKKTHGEWIVKPGTTTQELTVQSSTKANDNIMVVVKTVVGYKTLNKKAAWRVPTASMI